MNVFLTTYDTIISNQSIYLKLKVQNEFISANYNNAFQSLACISVYQGFVGEIKDNNGFWRKPGFKNPIETGVRKNFETERNELKFI